MQQSFPCFALHDGRAGNARQAEALGHWLCSASIAVPLQSAAPWRWFAPRRFPGAKRAFGDALKFLPSDSESLVIGCGRQAALATRLLRSATVRSVQILDPRIDSKHWDLVVVPAHDSLRGENVIVMQGSLNAIDDEWIRLQRDSAPQEIRLNDRLCAVFVGGPTDDIPLRLEDVLTAIAKMRADYPGTVYVCASARTPADWAEALRQLAVAADVRVWTRMEDGANPYAALLACADRIICTADSVNMLSESCATYAPVEFVPAPHMRGRVARFVSSLVDAERIHAFGKHSNLQTRALRESEWVAEEISRRLDLPPRTRAPKSA